MQLKKKLAIQACLVAPCLMLPAISRADTTYTYSGQTNGAYQVTISLDTSLTGAGLDNLAPGTDISGTLSSFSISDNDVPSPDTAGFPAADYSTTAPAGATALPANVIEIGTDSLGNITSWNIQGSYFVSYPAVPGEDPTDFYGEYTIVSNPTMDQTNLIVDNDAGFAPGGGSAAGPGVWSPTYAVPEPCSLTLIGGGLLGLMVRRRKH